jgi:hypothetical protein
MATPRLLTVLVSAFAALAAAQPALDDLASIPTPVLAPVFGAPSVTNAWGSLLAATSNVLAINAVELAPFSSGWDATNLYGWDVDTATLTLNGLPLPPSFSLWTPYSVLRNASVVLPSPAPAATVTTEVRWVFEAQAVLLEANITLPEGADATSLSATVDLRFPLRYYPRFDECTSWHYPTHSETCCSNWFPPEPAPGQNTPAYFPPTWTECAPTPSDGFSTLLQADILSPATSAFAFPGACAGQNTRRVPPPRSGAGDVLPSTDLNPRHLNSFRSDPSATTLDLGGPTATNASAGTWTFTLGGGSAPLTARLRLALVFSNTSSAATASAAQALAAQFDEAWADAKADWQTRFNAVFDPAHSHFSGHLPRLSASPATASSTSSAPTTSSAPPTSSASSAAGFSFDFADGFTSPMERIYYASIVGLLANERTNLPPSLPGGNPTCPVSLEAGSPVLQRSADDEAAAFRRVTPGTNKAAPATSGLDRYLRPTLGAQEDEWFLPVVSGSAFPSTSSGDSPWRLFVTGGGLNATTNGFFWDFQFGAMLLATLEPDTFLRQLLIWLSGAGDDGSPAFLSFWGYEWAAGRQVGNFYSANFFTLMELLQAYIRTTGDLDVLNTTITSANATVTLFDVAISMATHWRQMNASGYLADYGGAPNLLECVPTYIHRVASCNAGNVYMSNTMADLSESWKGDAALAAQLRSDADGIADDVLSRLYIPGTGYFGAEMPNGTLVPVQHVMDHTYVTLYLGVQRNNTSLTTPASSSPTANRSYIPPAVASEMASFVRESLIVPHWMRALALNDSAAPYSNRSDHGPSGAYIGWPALTIRSMGLRGDYGEALAFLNDTLFVSTLGPYGQAVEVNPPGLPYKPMDVTLYNALVSCSFADSIIRTFFGFNPPLPVPGSPGPLVDADVPRGFTGVLSGLAWDGAVWDIVSDDDGLTMQPQPLGAGRGA